MANRIDMLIDEINSLWSFIQRFVDETAIDMIHDVHNEDTEMGHKI